MRALSISSADAFILVYALDESQDASLDEIRGLRDLILATKGCSASGVPIVVVGNKLDLVEEGPQFTIDRETVESIVTLDWEHGYVQASAKDNVNVGKCFQELLNQAKVKYNLSPALRQRRRRQSLPAVAGSSPNSAASGAPPPPAVARPPVPSHAELEKLEKIRERHSTGDKRNSCVIS
jgi:GTPase SAR1 family protein